MEIVNPSLDIAVITDEFHRVGRVLIKNYLVPELAEQAYRELDTETEWGFVYTMSGERTALDAGEAGALEERDRLIPEYPNDEGQRVRYAFDRAPIDVEPDQRRSHGTKLLGSILAAMNSPKYIELIRAITGLTTGNFVDGWASRFRPGHYISPHRDDIGPSGRLAAHILGLTRNWEDGWGGQLTFCDDKGRKELQCSPSFNTLALFEVPRIHHVSVVSPAARQPRYSLFGWFKERDESNL